MIDLEAMRKEAERSWDPEILSSNIVKCIAEIEQLRAQLAEAVKALRQVSNGACRPDDPCSGCDSECMGVADQAIAKLGGA